MSEIKDELRELSQAWKNLFRTKLANKSKKHDEVKVHGTNTNQKIAIAAILAAVIVAGFLWYNSPLNMCIRATGHSVWESPSSIPLMCLRPELFN